jgi:galactokinase
MQSLAELLEITGKMLRERAAGQAQPIRHVIAPYRICPLGAHVDHQGGDVLGRTVNAYSILAFAPLPNPEIRLRSANFPGETVFFLEDAGRPQMDHWDRYARGAAHVLAKHHRLRRGFAGYVQGSLPGGGLSSSASVGLAYLAALAAVNDIPLSQAALVELDRQLENDYLGLLNGIQDQSAIVHGREKVLLHLDTRSRIVRPVLDSPAAADSRFVIFYSGFPRELRATGYNERVSECHQAARQLASLAGQPETGILADIPEPVFDRYKGELPDPPARRASHFFGEIKRVAEGRLAWAAGDITRFGALMTASCDSSIQLYEAGSPAIIQLQQIVASSTGVYGSRFSGGGYGGCVVALVDANTLPEVKERIEKRYLAAFPEAGGRAYSFTAEVEGGLRVV